MRSDLTPDSFKGKFSTIIFVCNLIIGCPNIYIHIIKIIIIEEIHKIHGTIFWITDKEEIMANKRYMGKLKLISSAALSP